MIVRSDWYPALSLNPPQSPTLESESGQSWNAFSYVGGNPLNFVDPDGRQRRTWICYDEFEDDDEVSLAYECWEITSPEHSGGSAGGNSTPGGGPGTNAPQTPSPAQIALDAIAGARDALSLRVSFSENCVKGLASILNDSGNNAGINPYDVADRILSVLFVDGANSAVSLYAAAGSSGVAAGNQNQAQGSTVGALFGTSGFAATTAWTPSARGVVYVNSPVLNGQNYDNEWMEAFVLHEALHALYPQVFDDNLPTIPTAAGGSQDTTRWLRKNCIRGEDNF